MADSDVVISVASSKLTLKNAADKKLNITGKVAATSKSFIEERWFLDNAECVMLNSELDSIIEDKTDIAVDYKFDDEKQFQQDLKILSNAYNKK